ncbi:MAG: exodeoxyribonuclease VII small subunit [Deltaproteobacteria bacterium]|nr:exodeoxyribonuclease VII small subunit [Deltaproteobacteria bacterium]
MAKKATPSAAEIPFEEALERLENLVDALEEGDLELEASLEKFEEGVKLVRSCSDRLKSAELRVKQLEAGADGVRESDLVLEDGS